MNASLIFLLQLKPPKWTNFVVSCWGYFTLALYTSAPSKLKGDLNYLRLEWGPDFQQHEAGLIGADEVPILTTSSAELAQQQIAMLNGCTWLPVSWARKKGGLHTVVDSTTLSRPLYAIWLQNSDKMR
ncbi:HTH-type transcriptional regulator hdfR [Escherichia coli]|uniref:HTH-type transcriptional regulator hdfR n=1 Tax=Escherichia coli TaxID=562 RepID=A0A376WAP2_ECOLX|nr:HTH-type transcriptional regulator hdfR [Escherichia coli]